MQYIILTEPIHTDSPVAKELFQRIRFSNKKSLLAVRFHERLASYGVLSVLLERVYHFNHSEQEIFYDENGKPSLSGVSNIFFSISHTKNAVAVVLAEHPIGVDVENSQFRRDPHRIIRRFFHQNEINWLDHFADDQKAINFYRLWTMKESLGKMTGIGMLPQLQLNLIPALSDDDLTLENMHWRLDQIDPNLYAACCAPKDKPIIIPDIITNLGDWLKNE